MQKKALTGSGATASGVDEIYVKETSVSGRPTQSWRGGGSREKWPDIHKHLVP